MKKILSILTTCLLITTIKAQTYHWAKSFGGVSDDQGRAIAVDASGNVYTTGFFKGTTDFDPGIGTANLTSTGGDDVFVQKMNASGNLLWVKSFGGTSDEYTESIVLDPSGNAYITGSFSGTVDFDPGTGTTNLTSTPGSNTFVQKMDASGNFLWAKSFGGSEGMSIAADAFGNVYTTGEYGVTADFDPGAGISNLTSTGGWEIFVQKMDASGNFQWAKSLGGSGNDLGWSVAVDAFGNVYTTGFFVGKEDFDPGAGITNLSSVGGDDVFVQKMNASGNFLWAKSFGGAGNDDGYSITVDPLGNVYTTGYFYGVVDFDPGAGTTSLTSIGSFPDAFVQKMDASGNFQWAKSFGGTNYERGYSITLDTSGNVYTTGIYSGTVDFDPGAGTANLSSNASLDIFIQKMDASGNFLWAKSFGGTNSEIGYSTKVDDFGNVYTTGWFAGTADFDPGVGTANLTSTGGSNIFVQKLRQCLSTFGIDVINTCNSYTWIDGNTYTASNNTATHVLTNTASCDSIVTLNLTINSNTGTDVIAACNVYTWIDGNTYTTSNNTATYTLTNSAGCDSVVTLDLTINNPNTGADIVTACDSYTWIDGNIYTTSNNTATHTLTNSTGCDSVVTLNLTIKNSSTGSDIITACDSYTWIDGNIYTVSNNTATHILTNSVGCDSVVTLDLTINNSSTGTAVITACDSYTWIDGNTYTTSNNTAMHTLVNSIGCDSVVTLNLMINSNTGTDVITACGSYTWVDGNTYTASNNTATYTLTNSTGCDSVVTLDLTINNSSTGTDIITACDSYMWIDGITYTASNNTAIHTLTNAAGCDSLVTLNLTINSVSDITTVLNGIHLFANNVNATYQWLDCNNDYAIISGETNSDFMATANGNYAVELTENGCVDTSICVIIKTVGILENDFVNKMNISPNPTDGDFSIDFGVVAEWTEISITDIAGKVIYTTCVIKTQKVDLSLNEPVGFYFVSIHSGEKKAIFKLIKE